MVLISHNHIYKAHIARFFLLWTSFGVLHDYGYVQWCLLPQIKVSSAFLEFL